MVKSISRSITANGKLLSLENPQVMGIINLTQDSFYAESRYAFDNAKEQIHQMISDGATIIDIGGMSTRPNSTPVSESEEIAQIQPIIEWCCQTYPSVFIAIDSYRTNVIRCAIDAGVDIINDISAGKLDEGYLEVVAQSGLPYIAMHMQGTPCDMQVQPKYENVITDLLDFFIDFKSKLNALGIYSIILDPGFGFGKTIQHNYQILKKLSAFEILDLPILAGISRKGMIWQTLHSNPNEALYGTITANTLALLQGVSILRVHDVKAAADTIKIFQQFENA